jgi:hypothetical protein
MTHQTCLIGYPPADDDVRHFLTTKVTAAKEAESRIRCFLIALFNKTAEFLENKASPTKLDRIQQFRDFMTKDQTLRRAGENRFDFYLRVLARAQEVRRNISFLFILSNPLVLKLREKSSAELELEVGQALMALRDVLNPEKHLSAPYIHAEDSKDKFVDVFIAFDEAQTLVDSSEGGDESRFVVLRRLLCSLSSSPLFVFFLSTTGKITQFCQPRRHDPSSRVKDGTLATPRPYIHFSFDQLMKNRKVMSHWKTLEHVTSMECVAHMGRPL